MEINEDQPNANKQGYLFQFVIARELIIIYILSETQRQAEEWESFIGDKIKSFQ